MSIQRASRIRVIHSPAFYPPSPPYELSVCQTARCWRVHSQNCIEQQRKTISVVGPSDIGNYAVQG